MMGIDDGRPLFATDVEIVLPFIPRSRIEAVFRRPRVETEAERALAIIRLKVRVALLCPYDSAMAWRLADEALVPAAYDYLIPCRTLGELEMFRDLYSPWAIISNRGKKFGKEFTDVFEYDTAKIPWIEAMNRLRAELGE